MFTVGCWLYLRRSQRDSDRQAGVVPAMHGYPSIATEQYRQFGSDPSSGIHAAPGLIGFEDHVTLAIDENNSYVIESFVIAGGMKLTGD